MSFQYFYCYTNQEDCTFSKVTGDKVNHKTGITVKYFQCNRGGTKRKTKEGSRWEKMQGTTILSNKLLKSIREFESGGPVSINQVYFFTISHLSLKEK